MHGIDFDFARYIAYRRGVVHQRARDGAAYAFSRERKARGRLAMARPVAMAVEATTRRWRGAAKRELLEDSVKVTDEQFPRAHKALYEACRRLHMEVPSLYAVPESSPIRAQTLGTNDEAYLLINEELLDTLTAAELIATIGTELGNLQNNHVVYSTALHYLTHDSNMFVRWIVQPAILALRAWSRRAEITCDRAGLVASRDLDATLAAMLKVAIGPDVDVAGYLADMPDRATGMGRYGEWFRSHPNLPKRVQAIQLFAESTFYKKLTDDDVEGSLGHDAVDDQVAEILKVF